MLPKKHNINGQTAHWCSLKETVTGSLFTQFTLWIKWNLCTRHFKTSADLKLVTFLDWGSAVVYNLYPEDPKFAM